MIRLTLLAAALIGLTACETVKGAGRDIESAGGAISSSARKVQSQL